jgi:hypothetical protein
MYDCGLRIFNSFYLDVGGSVATDVYCDCRTFDYCGCGGWCVGKQRRTAARRSPKI